MACAPNKGCNCGVQSLTFLNGTEAAIACFVNALQNALPLEQHANGIKRFKLCIDPWCVVCLSNEFQSQVTPQLCYKPATLKERVTLQLGATFSAFENGQERIENTAIPLELKNDLKAVVKAITLWYDRHYWLLGVSTICFLSNLHWKANSVEVDYEKTARMIVSNNALSATEVRFPFAAAYDYDYQEILWNFLDDKLRQYWTNNWANILQFRALRINAFQPIEPPVNVPSTANHAT